jgi:hypothetical protein
MGAGVKPRDKALAWLRGEVKSSPFGKAARIEVPLAQGASARRIVVAAAFSRPMKVVAPCCHELGVIDEGVTWRIAGRVDPDAIVIAEVFAKKTATTPASVIEACRRRLREYDDAEG